MQAGGAIALFARSLAKLDCMVACIRSGYLISFNMCAAISTIVPMTQRFNNTMYVINNKDTKNVKIRWDTDIYKNRKRDSPGICFLVRTITPL